MKRKDMYTRESKMHWPLTRACTRIDRVEVSCNSSLPPTLKELPVPYTNPNTQKDPPGAVPIIIVKRMSSYNLQALTLPTYTSLERTFFQISKTSFGITLKAPTNLCNNEVKMAQLVLLGAYRLPFARFTV